MRRHVVILLIAFALFAVRAEAQSNPCDASLGEVVTDPTIAYFKLTQFSRADFTSVVADVFQGASTTPIDTFTVPKAQLTLVPGTADCYATPWVPTGSQYVRDDTTQYTVASRAVSSIANKGSAQGPRGNPFVLSDPIPPLTAPETRVGR